MNDDFKVKFEWSREPQHVRQELLLLQQLYPDSRAEIADSILDRRGADYVIYCNGGAKYVDFKRRERGCSRYWREKDTPEIPVEIWNDIVRKIPGWTFRRDYITDWTIFIFNEIDSAFAHAVDFRDLSKAARENVRRWKAAYGSRRITSKSGSSYWAAETIFLPITELINAGVQITTIPARDIQQKSLSNDRLLA